MDFLGNIFKDNPSSTLSTIVIIFFILIIITISLAFYYDFKKQIKWKKNLYFRKSYKRSN